MEEWEGEGMGNEERNGETEQGTVELRLGKI